MRIYYNKESGLKMVVSYMSLRDSRIYHINEEIVKLVGADSKSAEHSARTTISHGAVR